MDCPFRMRIRWLLVCALMWPAISVQAAIPDMRVHLPTCYAGPDTYAGVTRRRDQGRPMDTQFQKAVLPPPGSSVDLSAIQTRVHNRLVREIYEHPEWTPDEVAKRWLDRCKANTQNPNAHLPPTIGVETLL